MSASPHNAHCDTCDHHVDDCRCSVCSDCGKYFDPFHANSDETCLGCHEKETALERQLEASLTGHVASSFDLPSDAALIAVDAQLARLLREGPPRRQGVSPKATAQKE